jgi:ATP-dependent Zn protease
MTSSPTEIATAYHEAGHAAMALALGRDIHRVTIRANHLRQGQCEIKKGRVRPAKDFVETEILILFAGFAAEARHRGEYDSAGATQDLRSIRAMTEKRVASQRQIERLERRMLAKAEYLLEQPDVWRAVELIAAELLRSTTISGGAARHLFDQAAHETGSD